VPDLVIEGQQLTLLRGSDGFLLWTRGGFVDNVIGLGPVRPGHAQAVAIISAFGRGEGSSDGTGSESAVVDIRAVTAADHVVWHRRVTATIRTTSHGPHTILEVGDANRIGDVQPDGTVDLAARVLIRAGKVHIQKAGIVSGRTGAFRAGPVETAASGSLVRGPGTDLIRVVASSAGIDVSGYDGVTGDRVMRRVVTTPGHVRHPFAAGLRVTGHACSDIETGGIFRSGREVVDLVSASGAPLWSLRFGKHQLTGGHVIRYPDPKHFCAG
jgi:hypothetical protein